jgi:hypothetical protein
MVTDASIDRVIVGDLYMRHATRSDNRECMNLRRGRGRLPVWISIDLLADILSELAQIFESLNKVMSEPRNGVEIGEIANVRCPHQ